MRAPLLVLLLAAGLAAGDAQAIAFRADSLSVGLRLPGDGLPPVPDLRLVLLAEQPRGAAVLRLDQPRFRCVETDSGERLAVLLRPAARTQEVIADRQAARERAVRLTLELSPPRAPVRRILGVTGSVRLTCAEGEPRRTTIALQPPPAKPVAIDGLPGVTVQFEALKDERIALVIPAELARRLAEPSFLDAAGVLATVKPGQRQPAGDGGLRLQFDLAGSGAVQVVLPWYPEPVVREVAVSIPALDIPGGIPGIGEAGAPPPKPPPRPRPRAPLHAAIADGDAAAVDWLLLADPAGLERPEGDGLRPLHRALLFGRGALAARLIAVGADATVVARDGRTPLALAVEGGNADCVQLLLERHADTGFIVPATGWTLLHTAVNAGSAAAVRLLLAAGLDPWTEAKDGRSAIDLARDQGRWPMLRMMVAAKP